MQRKLTFILFSSLLLIGGVCEMVPTSEPLDDGEIIGTYVANTDFDLADTLTLLNDSVYIRTIISHDLARTIDTGKWEFFSYPNDPTTKYLELKKFKMYNSVRDKGTEGSSEINPDTIPRNTTIPIWKYFWHTGSRERTDIRLGSPYGNAWKRSYFKDSLDNPQ